MKYHDVDCTQFSPYGAMWTRICNIMDLINPLAPELFL